MIMLHKTTVSVLVADFLLLLALMKQVEMLRRPVCKDLKVATGKQTAGNWGWLLANNQQETRPSVW